MNFLESAAIKWNGLTNQAGSKLVPVGLRRAPLDNDLSSGVHRVSRMLVVIAHEMSLFERASIHSSERELIDSRH